MQLLKWTPLKGLRHCQTIGLQKEHAKRNAQEMIATNIHSCDENLPRTEIIFVYAKKQNWDFTMYKMRRRTKVPYICDKSTQFFKQTVDCKCFCQTLSTTRQYCAEPALLMACASLQSKHPNIFGFIAENWISIC